MSSIIFTPANKRHSVDTNLLLTVDELLTLSVRGDPWRVLPVCDDPKHPHPPSEATFGNVRSAVFCLPCY